MAEAAVDVELREHRIQQHQIECQELYGQECAQLEDEVDRLKSELIASRTNCTLAQSALAKERVVIQRWRDHGMKQMSQEVLEAQRLAIAEHEKGLGKQVERALIQLHESQNQVRMLETANRVLREQVERDVDPGVDANSESNDLFSHLLMIHANSKKTTWS
eukprot:TRINITY_DN6927_c0_g1_i3.p1 TRINITY_DN6927_c0_g1~~TRINITY_DN6927_c0_g1_i3.p1  ORF type:complete len:162 (-),score=33.91 TRINITY_DN6927_c0_g1_i3:160-645(-)